MSQSLLEGRDLTVRHGQLVALHELCLRVDAGEVFAVVGALASRPTSSGWRATCRS